MVFVALMACYLFQEVPQFICFLKLVNCECFTSNEILKDVPCVVKVIVICEV